MILWNNVVVPLQGQPVGDRAFKSGCLFLAQLPSEITALAVNLNLCQPRNNSSLSFSAQVAGQTSEIWTDREIWLVYWEIIKQRREWKDGPLFRFCLAWAEIPIPVMMRRGMIVHWMRFPGAVGGLGGGILQMMCFDAVKKRNASFPSQPEVYHNSHLEWLAVTTSTYISPQTSSSPGAKLSGRMRLSRDREKLESMLTETASGSQPE